MVVQNISGWKITANTSMEVYRETRPADWLVMPEPKDDELYLLFHIPDGYSGRIAFTVVCTGQYTVERGTVVDGRFAAKSAAQIDSGAKYDRELLSADFKGEPYDSTVTSDGYRQVMVKVSGDAITSWAHSPTTFKGNNVSMSYQIVDMRGRLPNATSLSGLLNLGKLKYFSLEGASSLAAVDRCSSTKSYTSLIAVPGIDTSHIEDMTNSFSGCSLLRAIPNLDLSGAVSLKSMFQNCASLTVVQRLSTPIAADMSYMFDRCASLKKIPQLDTSAVTDASYMFRDCISLTDISRLNLPGALALTGMFADCTSLSTVSQLSAPSATKISGLFSGCDSLISVSDLDISAVEDVSKMFAGCRSLKTVQRLSTSAATNMASMFARCYSLTNISELDTSSATNMSSMFQDCASLMEIPQLDTHAVTNMSGMFDGCYSLKTVPPLDTSAVTNMSGMFNGCSCLQAIPTIDITSVTSSLKATFAGCASLQHVTIHAGAGWRPQDLYFENMALGREALVELFESLPAIETQKTLYIRNNIGNVDLTDGDKAIATDKGWVLNWE